MNRRLMFWYSNFQLEYVMCLPGSTFTHVPKFKANFYSISLLVLGQHFEEELRRAIEAWMR